MTDPRLKIELFASEPELVTPTGIAVDGEGRVYVIESHTHFRPDDYQGPPADRIRVFEDLDGDGRADQVRTFFQGTTATMNLAINEAGDVYVATRDEIFRLRDRNGDGRADENTTLARLESPGNYPHNGLSGFAFGPQGDVWFGFGENLGEPYKLVGADGTTLSGGGEGGSVFRMSSAGKDLQRVATGFWNPFHLCFDNYGQLFAVDNDPDWRPPCRLLHLVPGGDYGYRFSLGRRGTHPFSSWFGEVPGTLGMVAGTGEAPSGVICYQAANLPWEYQGHLLATSWGLHAIERFRLRPQGATYESQAETIVKGGSDFRPVGLAVAPDGSIYISDWVKRSYELHGHGRIWRLSSQQPPADVVPQNLPAAFRSADRGTSQAAARRLLKVDSGMDWLVTRLKARSEPLPRLRALAVETLAGAEQLTAEQAWEVLTEDPDPRVRIVAARYAPLTEKQLQELIESVSQSLQPETSPEERERESTRAESPSDATGEPRKTSDWFIPPLALAELLRRDDIRFPVDWLFELAAEKLPFLQQAVRLALPRQLTRDEYLMRQPPGDPTARVTWALVLRDLDPAPPEPWMERLLQDAVPEVRQIGLRWIGETRSVALRDQVSTSLRSDPAIESLFEAYLATLDLLEGDRAGADYERREIALLDELLQSLESQAQPRLYEAALARLWKAVKRDLAEQLPATLRAKPLVQAAIDGSQVALYLLRDIPRPEHRAALRQLLEEEPELSPSATAIALSGLDINDPRDVQALGEFMLPIDAEERFPVEIEREVLRHLIDQPLAAVPQATLNTLAVEHPVLAEDVERLVSPTNTPAKRAELRQWLEQLELSELESADIAAGKRLFFHPRLARCGSCHSIDGYGGDVGPDLSNAAALGWQSLKRSIVEPSEEIAPKYAAWIVVTLDGKVRTGILQTERGSEQVYADADGGLFRVEFNDIEQRQASGRSLMPDGLLENLTREEIRNLLAYLVSREG